MIENLREKAKNYLCSNDPEMVRLGIITCRQLKESDRIDLYYEVQSISPNSKIRLHGGYIKKSSK